MWLCVSYSKNVEIETVMCIETYKTAVPLVTECQMLIVVVVSQEMQDKCFFPPAYCSPPAPITGLSVQDVTCPIHRKILLLLVPFYLDIFFLLIPDFQAFGITAFSQQNSFPTMTLLGSKDQGRNADHTTTLSFLSCTFWHSLRCVFIDRRGETLTFQA